MSQSTFITPIGTHAVSIGHQSGSPVNAFAVVQAILDAYTDLYTAQIAERAESSKQFFEEQLEFARASMERAHSDLMAYIPSNPIAGEALDESAGRAEILAAAATDIELARLIGAEETAREDYERIFARFAEVQIAANSADAGNSNFRVLDTPQVPAAPQGHGKRDLLLKPMLGLVCGVFISGGLFVLISRLDRRVWLPADLDALRLPVPIMTLPRLRSPSRRWPRSFVRLSTALRSGLKGHDIAHEMERTS